jgi:mRNA interferase MazF
VSNPKRGEIYFVNLDPTQGREQAGKRPVLVLSVDAINQLPLVVIVLVGTKGENVPRDYPTNVRVGSGESGLPMETVFMGFQVRSLDASRFPGQSAGQLSNDLMKQVEKAVKYCLGFQ